MLNLNEADVQKAIVEKVADDILNRDHDLGAMVRAEVKTRIDKIFVDRAQAQIEAVINETIKGSFEHEYQRMTQWGAPDGPKTTLRAELEKTVSGYWTAKVDPRNGSFSASGYNAVTRAEYLMTQVCAADFTKHMQEAAVSVTGALKDGFRGQMAKHMDELLDSLFRVKSLQDQGKVEKPY